MDRAVLIDHVRADSARLLAAQQESPHALAWEGLGWDRTQLLEHVAHVHARIRAQLEAGPAERIRFSEVPAPPGGDALARTFSQGVDDLVHLLEEMDVAIDWPTWAGQQPGTFFPRRMAQEMSIHRWDAVGGDIEAALAVDGVTELLELFAPRLPTERFGSTTGTLHLHATDVEGEWLVQLGPDRVTFQLGHAKGDVALRGRASDLLLWAWNRAPVDDRFEVFGDLTLLGAWRTTVVF